MRGLSRTQLAVILGALGLILVLYFGFATKPPAQRQVEATRALNAESTDVTLLIREAHEALSAAQNATIAALEQNLEQAAVDSVRVEVLKQLSGQWYEVDQPAISGFYAQEVAQVLNTEEAWSIAGTTYAICLQRTQEERVREFCSNRAVQAFESAISLNPQNVAHKVNLALTYTDHPPADNPMRGVLMLRELQEQYPENPLVLVSLGRLAIRTGQYQRAVQRLQQALAIEPGNRNALCLMAQAYEGLGDQKLARAYNERCGGK